MKVNPQALSVINFLQLLYDSSLRNSLVLFSMLRYKQLIRLKMLNLEDEFEGGLVWV